MCLRPRVCVVVRLCDTTVCFRLKPGNSSSSQQITQLAATCRCVSLSQSCFRCEQGEEIKIICNSVQSFETVSLKWSTLCIAFVEGGSVKSRLDASAAVVGSHLEDMSVENEQSGKKAETMLPTNCCVCRNVSAQSGRSHACIGFFQGLALAMWRC